MARNVLPVRAVVKHHILRISRSCLDLARDLAGPSRPQREPARWCVGTGDAWRPREGSKLAVHPRRRARDAALVRGDLVREQAAPRRSTPAGAPSPLSDQVLVQTKDLPPGLDLRLSDGKQGAARVRPREARAGEEARRRRGRGAARARAGRSRPIQTTSRRSRCGRSRSRRRAPARRSRAASRRRRRRCCRRRRTTPARTLARPALDARGRGAARARAQRHVQPADGRGDVAGRCRGDHAGEAHAAAEGQLALDRHAHDPVRSRGPVPAGDDVPGRDSRGHEERDRRRAQGRR